MKMMAALRQAEQRGHAAVASSKSLRLILTAVLAWGLAMLTVSLGLFLCLVYMTKMDMGSAAALGTFFTVCSGIVVLILRALIVGARMAETNGNGSTATRVAPASVEPEPE